MATEVLEADVDVASTFQGLLVRIQNQTPPNWGVAITAITLDFVYSDATQSNTSKNTNLGAGQSAILQSNDKCVFSHAVALRVEYGGKTEILTRTYGGTRGQCQLRNDIILAPKLMFADEKSGEHLDADRLEIR